MIKKILLFTILSINIYQIGAADTPTMTEPTLAQPEKSVMNAPSTTITNKEYATRLKNFHILWGQQKQEWLTLMSKFFSDKFNLLKDMISKKIDLENRRLEDFINRDQTTENKESWIKRKLESMIGLYRSECEGWKKLEQEHQQAIQKLSEAHEKAFKEFMNSAPGLEVIRPSQLLGGRKQRKGNRQYNGKGQSGMYTRGKYSQE